MANLNIIERVKTGFSLLQLDEGTMRRVFDQKDSFLWGVIFLIIPVVLSSFFAALSFPSGFGSIFSKFVFWPICIPFLALACAFMVVPVFVEQSFKVKIEWRGFVGLLGHAAVVLWLTVAVFMFDAIGFFDISGLFNLLWLVGIGWIFFVAYRFLIKVKGLSHKDALISVVVGVFALFLIQILLGKILVGGYYRVFY